MSKVHVKNIPVPDGDETVEVVDNPALLVSPIAFTILRYMYGAELTRQCS